MANTTEVSHQFVKNLEPTHIGWIETTGAMSDLLGLQLNSEHLQKPQEKQVVITSKEKRFTAHILRVALDMLDKAVRGYLLVKHNNLASNPNSAALTTAESHFSQAARLLEELWEQALNQKEGIFVATFTKPDFEESAPEYAELLLAYSLVTFTLAQLHHERAVSYNSLMLGKRVDLNQFNELHQITPHTALSFWNNALFDGEKGYRAINRLRHTTTSIASNETSYVRPYTLLSAWHFFTSMNQNNQALAQQSQELIIAEANKDNIEPATIQTNTDQLRSMYNGKNDY